MISPRVGPKRGWFLGALFGGAMIGAVIALESRASGPVLFFLGCLLGMLTTISFDLLLELPEPPKIEPGPPAWTSETKKTTTYGPPRYSEAAREKEKGK